MSKKITKNRQKINELIKDVENKIYSLDEAIEMAKKTSFVKFDASIDISLKLNLDTRKADQQLRGSVSLPNGTGKIIRVLATSDEKEQLDLAKKAGANIVANKSDLEEILKSEKFDFDIMVTDPKMMPTLGKYGKVLGPKGLMPNPKTGTVTPNIAKAVEEIKKGKANYRADKGGIINSSIGKVSMGTTSLVENAKVLIDTIRKLKPATVKGIYMQNLTISTTMGPSFKIKIEN
ncbi:50S ribosomal protein L1 [[Mycoplasma] mobile]|uniref:Large ribosomal subunit protein uL1 n=1 Tax=Mycoplasma mobile (strain ATCC 43663 / 163K / NCTC 11711) TaxID=267748 RepID=RL1_MYCM1|nr:50S ribosomal protein L1 [[Mycoplasma] mobile]Q6KIF1.1 RecName: Full=Large ribosomal subunit protein uL1; AltName: Full=50S ribosomal protein L1 [Mycoplasma mobile 163K]AAT27625.1 50S ribosomal protein l1 [Mycoplasma mobile 163K]